MKKSITHPLTVSMFVTALIILAGTLTAGDRYPMWFTIIWCVYAVTLGFAVVAVRRSVRNGR